MAMLQMQRIFIYALNKDRKQILELLQRRGVVETADMLKEDSVFHHSDVSYARASFERNIAASKEALDILKAYVPENNSILSMLNGRKVISTEIYDTFGSKYESVVKTANKIISLSKKIAENKAEIIKLQTQIEIITPWISLDIPMNFTGTKHTTAFIGTLPKAWTLDAIYEKLAEYMPVDVDIISSSKDMTCIFALSTKDKREGVYEILRGMDFSYPNVTFDQAPAEQLDYLTKLQREAEEEIRSAEEEIKSCVEFREDILFLHDYDTLRSEKYEVIGNSLQSENVFVLNGFIPEREAKDLSEELNSKFDIEVEISKTRKKDNVPVQLENNAFSAPMESTLVAFSAPGKGEIDPTMVMSIFYYLLFGLMLSDSGYGLMIVAVCSFCLIKFKDKLELPMVKTLRMYLICGVSTIFWGIVFGSYFGDLLDVISVTFFGNTALPIIPPLWFYPVEKPMLMLTFSMAFGVVHLLTGLGMKAYQYARNKDYIGIVYDVVFWYMLLVGGIISLLSMDMVTSILGISVNIPEPILKMAGILAALGAIGIILTNGRESKNPAKRVLKGLYSLYGVSGYLSDVLSYSRLLALGLATGVICSVFNKMAGMVGSAKIIGPFLFLLVAVAGHLLNFAISALGAYVHACRLQYVEFFGKFYEGGGRMFKPFHVNTKYYKFKENIKDGNIE
ncbi:MAG TPA: V-type ATP synthase subunit I [Mobilitalea sp.]|nr:V-type ATP synthase subunit I [Mobilitalea sp.]